MRPIPPRSLTGLLALVLVASLATVSQAARTTIVFRAESPESTAARQTRAEVRRAAHDSLQTRADAVVDLDADTTSSATRRSGRITRFGDDVTIARDQSVDGDVSSMGGDVEVQGRVKGSVSSTRGDLTVGQDGRVDGDLVSFGGDIEVAGHVTGDVSSTGGDVTLRSGARIDGDVVCIGGTLTEEDDVHIGGQRVTAAGTFDRGSRAARHHERNAGHRLGAHLGFLLFMLLVAWLLTLLAPGRTQAALDRARLEPGVATGFGALLLVLMVPGVIAVALVSAVLCITIVGIPLAIALLLGYFVLLGLLLVWGATVGCALLGERLAARQAAVPPTLVRIAVTGVLALLGAILIGDLLHLIPVIGFIGTLVKVVAWAAFVWLTLFGAGAMIRSEIQRGSLQDWWRRIRPAKVPVHTPATSAHASAAEVVPEPSPAPPAPPASPSSSGESGPIA